MQNSNGAPSIFLMILSIKQELGQLIRKHAEVEAWTQVSPFEKQGKNGGL